MSRTLLLGIPLILQINICLQSRKDRVRVGLLEYKTHFMLDQLAKEKFRSRYAPVGHGQSEGPMDSVVSKAKNKTSYYQERRHFVTSERSDFNLTTDIRLTPSEVKKSTFRSLCL